MAVDAGLHTIQNSWSLQMSTQSCQGKQVLTFAQLISVRRPDTSYVRLRIAHVALSCTSISPEAAECTKLCTA